MKLKETLEKLDSFEEGERKKYIHPLYEMLTVISKTMLAHFQDTWDGTRPFEEFVKEQNETIRYVVNIEMGKIGTHVRETLGLVPLTEDTEIGGDKVGDRTDRR